MTRYLTRFDPTHLDLSKFGSDWVLTRFDPFKFDPTRPIVTPSQNHHVENNLDWFEALKYKPQTHVNTIFNKTNIFEKGRNFK